MQKLGRNDRCHCGSGLKYKKCCLAKDEAANVTRIVEPQMMSWTELIDQELEWPNELHRLIAHHFLQNTLNFYEDEHIESSILIWNMFVLEEQPISKKLGVYPAALEYVLCQIFEFDITQKELADKYNISVSTLSQRANQLFDFLEYQAADFLSNEPPSVSFQSSIGNASSIGAEQEMARIHAMLAEQEFDSIDEMNAFLEQNLNKEHAKKVNVSKEEQAMDLVYEAWNETSTQRRMQLAQDALLLDSNCIDAFNILAECATTTKEQAYYYKQGMQVGEKHLGEAFFNENKGRFWGYVPTRPYMRAKKGYAETCAMMDKMPEAIQHYRELLELNPNDNQGVRDLLLSAYIETMDLSSAEQLIQQFDQEYSASFNYGRVLVEFETHGKSPKLTSIIKEAVAQNRFVPIYLRGTKHLPHEIPEYIGIGDENEAIVYCFINRHLWLARPELLQLLPER